MILRALVKKTEETPAGEIVLALQRAEELKPRPSRHPAPIYATRALSKPSILAATSASSRRSARNTLTRNAAERKNGQSRTSDSVQIEGLTFRRGTQ